MYVELIFKQCNPCIMLLNIIQYSEYDIAFKLNYNPEGFCFVVMTYSTCIPLVEWLLNNANK